MFGGCESGLQGSQLGKGALDFALKFLRSSQLTAPVNALHGTTRKCRLHVPLSAFVDLPCQL